MLAAVLPAAGCCDDDVGGASVPAAVRSPSVAIRPVRVHLVTGARSIRVRGETSLVIAGEGGSAVTHAGEDWVTFSASRDGRVLREASDESSPAWTLRDASAGAVWLSAEVDGRVMPARPYPGSLALSATDGGDGVDAINHVDIEEYVACVAARETWPSAPVEAFRAQAVAVRSYVLHWMRRRQSLPVDVSATQSSQVYAGRVSDETGRRAREAAESTRGVVCVASGDGGPVVLPAYYSAACGGWTQSMSAFGGGEPLLEPLAGAVRCSYCAEFDGADLSWKPAHLPVATLLDRLGPLVRMEGSGGASDPSAAGALVEITALPAASPRGNGSAEGDRPVAFRLVWSSGASEPIPAEQFRFAVGPQLMRSTVCRISVSDGRVTFRDGRGAGHGVGLCQRGACVMAEQGRSAAEILHFYYPGATLSRAY